MGAEVNLLRNYPKTSRDLNERLELKSPEVREIARQFGKDFFDGDRKFGYGGFSYNEKYWTNVVHDFVDFYELAKDARVLDVGCAKGFMLYDFQRLFPSMEVFGLDISEYAIENALPEVAPYLTVGNAKELPFEDSSFDLVISINTIHNLPRDACATALREIQRVTAKNSFITVDAYSTPEEKLRMDAWNLTAKTIMSKSEWSLFFEENGYEGDFYWFIP